MRAGVPGRLSSALQPLRGVDGRRHRSPRAGEASVTRLGWIGDALHAGRDRGRVGHGIPGRRSRSCSLQALAGEDVLAVAGRRGRVRVAAGRPGSPRPANADASPADQLHLVSQARSSGRLGRSGDSTSASASRRFVSVPSTGSWCCSSPRSSRRCSLRSSSLSTALGSASRSRPQSRCSCGGPHPAPRRLGWASCE